MRGGDVRRSRGKDAGRRADIAGAGLGTGAQDPKDYYKRVLDTTKPAKRAEIETYMGSLQKELERQNEQQKAQNKNKAGS